MLYKLASYDKKLIRYLEEKKGKNIDITGSRQSSNPVVISRSSSACNLREKAHNIYNLILKNYMHKPETDIGNGLSLKFNVENEEVEEKLYD